MSRPWIVYGAYRPHGELEYVGHTINLRAREWRNVKDYPTWKAAILAFPEGFTGARAFKLWGKRT